MRRVVLTEPQWVALVATLDCLPLSQDNSRDLREATAEVKAAPYQVSVKRNKVPADR